MVLRVKVISLVIATILFYRFYKGYNDFKEIPLDSKHNRMNEFNKLLTSFKNIETKKPETQLKKEQIIKNVNEP